ncbi:MAG TPA: hypothetical protein VIL43_06860 [Burkholderiales bacterium]
MIAPRTSRTAPSPLALAAAAFASLAAWGVHFASMRGLAPLLCGPPASAWFYAVTAALLFVVLIAGVYAGRGYLAGGRTKERREAVSARYFGLVGSIGAVIFGIGIVAQAAVFHAACVD